MKKKNIKATKAYKLGDSGENKVKLMLDSFNNPDYNIHNIMLLDKNGDTHQIDLISITSAGVFVIEVKNVCGYKIYGEPDQTYWKYDWVKNKELIHCELYNPIMQNKTHVEKIHKILSDFNAPIFSLIVFPNKNQIIHQWDFDEPVINSIIDMKNYILKFPQNKISEEQKLLIKNKILKYHHPEIKLQEHVDNINKKRGS